MLIYILFSRLLGNFLEFQIIAMAFSLSENNMDFESDESIIPPSGLISSTDNISTKVIINGNISSFLMSPIRSNLQSNSQSSDMNLSLSQSIYDRGFPQLLGKKNKPIPLSDSPSSFTGFDENGCAIKNNVNNSVSISDDTNSHVIIIEPQSKEQLKSFFNNDLRLAKNLQNSIIGTLGIKNVRKNMSRQILIVELENPVQEKIQEILDLKGLGEFPVTCRLPLNKTVSYGVIGPIGLDTSMDELKHEILSQKLEFTSLERIYKGKDKTPTLFIKIAFNLESLPEFLKIGYQRHRVKQYIGTPWQCYRCQGFGHSAPHCRFKPRCLVCSGPHELRECDQRKNNGRATQVKCPNCQGAHTANYGGCPSYQKAKIIEKIRVEKKLSYRDATKLHTSMNNNATTSQTIMPPNSNVATSQTQMLLNVNAATSQTYPPQSNLSMTRAASQPAKSFSTIATQTFSTMATQTETPVETKPDQPNKNNELFIGIAKIICDLLNLDENNPVAQSTIINSVNKNFGTHLKEIDITDDPSIIPIPASQSDGSVSNDISFPSPTQNRRGKRKKMSKEKISSRKK